MSNVIGVNKLDVWSPSALTKYEMEDNGITGRHTAKRVTSLRAASQIVAEYNGLDCRDSTALNLSATLTALVIEVG